MIIDIHVHRGPIPKQYVEDYSLARLLKSMDAIGIRISISCNTLSLMFEDFENGAEQALSDYRQSDNRVYSYFYFHPKYVQQSLCIMQSYKHEPAFRGIKIHPSMTNTYGNDESYRPVWEFASENGYPILAHTWDISPYNLNQKYSYPDVFAKYLG
jgi:predicted TIM-barrel fold metal-dependent hydrolase